MKSAIQIAMVTAVAAGVIGCADRPPRQPEPDTRVYGERFLMPGEMGHPERVDLAQQRAGARYDSTLHGFHFDGGTLNSLGQQKLMLILPESASTAAPESATTQPSAEAPSAHAAAGATANPLLVYIDTPRDDRYWPAQRDAVVGFAREHGLAEGALEVRHGQNPACGSPTAPVLADLNKAEQKSASASDDMSLRAGK